MNFVFLLLLLGCWAYCILAIVGTLRHSKARPLPAAPPSQTGISILKPLSGLDHDLAANLRSYFEQAYTNFELLFAVRHSTDAAVRVVHQLQREYPAIQSQLIFTGEPPYPHDKVFKLQSLLETARYELVVMSDSDVRVGPDFCQSLAGEFHDQSLDLVTCPYRAIAGPSLWSRLEAIGMNTDFHAGLFTAVLMEGARFAVGPTIVARRKVLQALGGIARFKDYLSSEDFMLGRVAAESGYGVRLSSYVVEHHIGAETLRQNFAHRLRWARTTRRSRPWGYVGQFFTYPFSALLCIAVAQSFWLPLLLFTTVLRLASAWSTSQRTLGARVEWLLLPLHDLLGFSFWLAGFFGKTVHWRGQRYILNRDGTLQPAS